MIAKRLLRRIYIRVLSFLSLITNNDRLSIILRWKVYNMPYKLDLNNPKTYNEKLQWLKLYNRCPVYTRMVDKVEAKAVAARIMGEEHIIKTIGVWDSIEDISWSELPHSFVMKCSHDSGGVIICKDKNTFNVEEAKSKLKHCLKRNYYRRNREWPYKNVKRRILCEEYMEDYSSGELRDYKFFCFNGIPQLMFIATDRQKVNTSTKFDFYDMDFNHLPIINGHPNSDKALKMPAHFQEMQYWASRLSEGIPHVRIDFYEINGKVYFGEYTFFHFSGFVPIEPIEWDFKIGGWLELPLSSDSK